MAGLAQPSTYSMDATAPPSIISMDAAAPPSTSIVAAPAPSTSPKAAPAPPSNSPTAGPAQPSNSPTAGPAQPSNSATVGPAQPSNSPMPAPTPPSNSTMAVAGEAHKKRPGYELPRSGCKKKKKNQKIAAVQEEHAKRASPRVYSPKIVASSPGVNMLARSAALKRASSAVRHASAKRAKSADKLETPASQRTPLQNTPSLENLSPAARRTSYHGSKRRRRKLVSRIWEEAEPIYDSDEMLVEGRCIHCQQIFPATRDTGTSHIRRHLKVHTPGAAPAIMWSIWSSGDRWMHGEVRYDPVNSIKLTGKTLALLDVPRQQATVLPGHIKINTDAAVLDAEGKNGAGGIARSQSSLMGAWYKPHPGATDRRIAEALALRDGVIFKNLRSFAQVVMETDSLEVVNLWNTRLNSLPLSHQFSYKSKS